MRLPLFADVATEFEDDLAALLSTWDGNPQDKLLTEWQHRQRHNVVAWVREKSPFYREKMAANDPAESGFFTTKHDLGKAGLDILSGSLRDADVYYETTGTTGPSTPCPRSSLEVRTSNGGISRAWANLLDNGDNSPRPVVALLGPSELYAFGDVFGAVSQSLDLAHVKLWPDSPRVGMDKALKLLRMLSVEFVVCAPSMVLDLAREISARGWRTSDFPIRRFFVLGEVSTPSFRRNAESIWPHAAVVPGMYGSQEAMCIAAGWRDGTLRITEPNYLVELIDTQTSETVHDSGELVVTMLTPGVKPLIRYRTGDLVRIAPWKPGDLPGRALTVLGRTRDQLRLTNGTLVTAYDIEEATLSQVDRCWGYEILIDDGSRGDELTIRLHLADDSAVGTHVGAELAALTGARVRVDVIADLDPRTSQGAGTSWKAARIRDQRRRAR